MSELATFLAFAHQLTDDSAALAQDAWARQLDLSYKADGSAVTRADRGVEARWRERISDAFSEHGILGGEYGQQAGQSAYTWALDPSDGTRQFAAGLLNYASLIALCRDGVPVLGLIDLPGSGARYAAALGMGATFNGARIAVSGQQAQDAAVINLSNPDSYVASRPGFAALQVQGRLRVYDGGSPAYGALARGRIDVCLNGDDLDAFDLCALCPVVTEAGGKITAWSGGALSLASSGAIVASASAPLHHAVLGILNAA